MMSQDNTHVERPDCTGKRQLGKTRSNYGWIDDTRPAPCRGIGRLVTVAVVAVISFLAVQFLQVTMQNSGFLPGVGLTPRLAMMVDTLFVFCIAFCLARSILGIACRSSSAT